MSDSVNGEPQINMEGLLDTEEAAVSESPRSVRTRMPDIADLVGSFAEVNKELWLVLSLIGLAGLMNYLIASQRMILGLYTLPTLLSAYFFGRRHAVFTAFASIFLVGLLAHFNPNFLEGGPESFLLEGRWFEFTAWAGTLAVTAYAMGTLQQRSRAQVRELQQTYYGLLLILRQFISKDKYTENHSYRVSIYATNIAASLGFKTDRLEVVRTASLLHDIGKLDVSRQILYKASKLTQKEFDGMKKHVDKAADILEPVEGPLGRALPIILSHHDKFDGSGYRPHSGEEIPLESRIITVADVYDSLTSDRPYRKAMSPYDAKEIILKGSGNEFDPSVVRAFEKVFYRGELEVPEVVL